ncbi:NACHT domain- and WD repeat-containing protein 1-like [Hippopotamus amphibius kiboko]|uniref:NACHT domain- and WD repeat-containing protein 1-like n=1 Tax=Hippopotamus amphibius kiboko TaxID=575201 RepID=UPI002599C552|nr:NACHT domain- and WD repeat-containing protein 1-like [Hippopotamus amphibius kiboko]
MDAEREALQSTAYPEVQTFCQKHGLMFEVVDLRWGIRNTEATDHLTTELCLEELDRCRKTSIGPAFVALVGDQYGPCPVPTLIEEKEWEALKAQLTTRPRDLELVARRFRRDENAVPPTYLLQALHIREARGPEEATLTSALRSGAQEARRLGLITQEQWHRYHRSGEAAGTSLGVPGKCPRVQNTHHVLSRRHSLHFYKCQTNLALETQF